MPTTTSHLSVAAPVEAVWGLLADYADISRWSSDVSQSSLLTAGAPELGAVRRVQVGRVALRETVTVWEPGRSLGYRLQGLPAVVTAASNTWTLEPDGAGTAVTLTSEAQTRGGPLVARLVGRQLGKAVQALVRDLAADLQRQP